MAVLGKDYGSWPSRFCGKTPSAWVSETLPFAINHSVDRASLDADLAQGGHEAPSVSVIIGDSFALAPGFVMW